MALKPTDPMGKVKFDSMLVELMQLYKEDSRRASVESENARSLREENNMKPSKAHALHSTKKKSEAEATNKVKRYYRNEVVSKIADPTTTSSSSAVWKRFKRLFVPSKKLLDGNKRKKKVKGMSSPFREIDEIAEENNREDGIFQSRSNYDTESLRVVQSCCEFSKVSSLEVEFQSDVIFDEPPSSSNQDVRPRGGGGDEVDGANRRRCVSYSEMDENERAKYRTEIQQMTRDFYNKVTVDGDLKNILADSDTCLRLASCTSGHLLNLMLAQLNVTDAMDKVALVVNAFCILKSKNIQLPSSPNTTSTELLDSFYMASYSVWDSVLSQVWSGSTEQ